MHYGCNIHIIVRRCYLSGYQLGIYNLCTPTLQRRLAQLISLLRGLGCRSCSSGRVLHHLYDADIIIIIIITSYCFQFHCLEAIILLTQVTAITHSIKTISQSELLVVCATSTLHANYIYIYIYIHLYRGSSPTWHQCPGRFLA